jgi:antibiotic biosynthesis monooxygenase (ABM) superfamily enzyme
MRRLNQGEREMKTPKQAPPPRHKMALLTWSGAWALITLILWLLGPMTASWPLPLRTLLISVLMVVGLTWVVIPFLTRTFAAWLAPAQRRDRPALRVLKRVEPAA